MSLLQRHGITAVADVRSTPYSRFNPQFRREKLQASLSEAGAEKIHQAVCLRLLFPICLHPGESAQLPWNVSDAGRPCWGSW